MPRKSAQASVAEQQAAPGGAAAVDRALSLLNAFRAGDRALTLTELAGRTGLYKSTALRLMASLQHAGLSRQLPDGRYALGAALARLHAVYASGFSLEEEVMPALRELVALTQESAAFHVRQGDQRVCLHRVDSPQLLRDHIRAGDVLPLDRGAGGRVLLAFAGGAAECPAGAQGRVLDQIRRDGVAVLSGDRVPDLTGVSAPVFGARGELVGALTLTLPVTRMQPAFVPAVKHAAARLSQRLGHLAGAAATAPDGA